MTDARAISHGAKSSSKGERGVQKRLQALGRLAPLTGHRLLDVGCADGTYTFRLAESFETVDAIDIEPERLADIRARVAGTALGRRITVADMSADNLSFADATFDAVTAIEVLEHVRDLDRTFAEVRRVLKPGGWFLATTPNRWFPFETHGPVIAGRRRKSWLVPGLPWVSPLHRRWSDARAFTLRELRRGAEAHGLTLVGHEYMMPPFDQNRLGRKIRPVTDQVERSPLRFVGMTHILAFQKWSGLHAGAH
jgi:ubiquinone/menaquinone biosynthesis C-methylase UbiE